MKTKTAATTLCIKLLTNQSKSNAEETLVRSLSQFPNIIMSFSLFTSHYYVSTVPWNFIYPFLTVNLVIYCHCYWYVAVYICLNKVFGKEKRLQPMLLSLHTSPFRIASFVKLIGVKQRVSGNSCLSFKIKREVSFWIQIRAPLTIL